MKKFPITFRVWSILGLIALAAVSIGIFVAIRQTRPSAKVNDWLVFRRIFDYEKGIFEVLATPGGDPQLVISLGNYRGVPSLSRDGKYLAVSCVEDYSQICILDLQGLEAAKATKNQVYNPPVLKTIQLPEACQAALSNRGVESISWSFNDTKLAVVCSEIHYSTQKQTCILPLTQLEQSSCWENPGNSINRVEWSPVDDRLLVSSLYQAMDGKVYLIDSPGQAARFLTAGWGASWSPDGQQIAFLRWVDDYFTVKNGEVVPKEGVDETNAGLAIMNIDGTNLKWLYKSPKGPMMTPNKIAFSCWDSLAVCNTTWAPDGKFIAFDGITFGMFNLYIFKINIETGEITQITIRDINIESSHFNSAPSWGK